MHMKIAPHAFQAPHRLLKIIGIDRQRRRIDRPGRGAANNRERVGNSGWQDAGQRLEHPHLISGTRAAARHNHRDFLFAYAHRPLPTVILLPCLLEVSKYRAARRQRSPCILQVTYPIGPAAHT